MPKNNVLPKKVRLTILTDDEINVIYQLPHFNHLQRQEYFSLEKTFKRELDNLVKIETRVYLILLVGYYRAKPVIPIIDLNVLASDINYICETHFNGEKYQSTHISKSTRFTLVTKMLTIVGAIRFKQSGYQKKLDRRLHDVAMISTDPRYLFDECLTFFGQNHIVLPGYTTLQDLITNTLAIERQRTENILRRNMSDDTKQKLEAVLSTKGVLNSLSAYRGSIRNFTPTDINRELESHALIQGIYPELKSLIKTLSLSHGNMDHYASIVKHHSLYKLRRYPQWQGLLYLVVYLYFRYRESNDKLVTTFQYLVRKTNEAQTTGAKIRIANELKKVRHKLKEAGSVLNLFLDNQITNSEPFGKVRKKAFKVLTKKEMKIVSQHLNDNDFDQPAYEWQHFDKNQQRKLQIIRKLFIAIDVQCADDLPVMRTQIDSAKQELLKKRKLETIDQRIIRQSARRHILLDGEMQAKRFEFYLYQRIFKMMNTDQIYVVESLQYKKLEDDLIPKKQWEIEKQQLIKSTGLLILQTPISQAIEKHQKQHKILLEKVANSIDENNNEYVKKQPKLKQLAWSLANKKTKDSVDNPIYGQIQHMGIIEIMQFVDKQTQYLDVFTNVSSRKRRLKANKKDLVACIFGNAANLGINILAANSDRALGSLRSVNDNYLRLETIRAANDKIANETAKLPIFKRLTIDKAMPFGSMDGQKFKCRLNTFKARFSAKYFRKGSGVSAMTLVSNHVPVDTAIISPNEYEAHFAFDLLYNNNTDVEIKSLASDNHGINNVNFAILDFFGYKFSPRYAKFKRAFEKLFTIDVGEETTIQLKEPINIKLIEDQWDEVQRILCSLSRKTGSQSVIIKKLSSNKQASKTLEALHEYDRLVKANYFLEYVDSKTLRHYVHQSLNRGEAYHQLRRAISNINGNQFRGGSDYEVDLWNECARLVANCIIYYNAIILSKLFQRYEKEGNKEVVEFICGLSPVAWIHIQLSGFYTFGNGSGVVDILEMIQNIDASMNMGKEI